MRFSFRGRLLLGFVVTIGATGGIATVMGAYLIGDRFVRQAQAKVAQDINSARVIYENEIARLQDLVRLNADRPAIQECVARGDVAIIRDLLGRVSGTEGVDLLLAVDAKGTVLGRARPDAAVGYSLAANPAIRKVLETGEEAAGTEVIDPEELRRHSPDLAERARIPLVPTARARPTDRVEEARGMAIVAAAPVWGPEGRMAGALFGGRLLNRTDVLVDRIQDTVYRGEVYQGREIGTATLFLGDVRIATTVRSRDGRRAIGTRIQAEVGDRVLGQGKPWSDRAFVVNGWYLTAYEPIRGLSGEVIGILYVGMREDKFVALRRETVLAFLGVTLAGMALAGLIAWALARNVLRPIRRLVAASKEISAGNFEHHVPEASRDEFGSLERAFNRMTEAIRERDREIREAAELRLVRSAALASLGRLAASVAHEVNNPLAGILVYLRLMLKYMTRTPFPAERVEEMVSWLKAMESETARCGRLVQGMLQLGREPPMKLSDHDLNAIAEKSIVLLERRFALGNVKVERKFDAALPAVQCDGEQIQQTIMGLVLNAFEAMPRGGTVTIATRRQPDGDGVQIRVADEGIGIPPENLPRLFDAFFTTKGDGKGVGLGLSIAHAIVRRHQGRIDVESEVGRGTTFTVTLPLRQGPRADAAPREADGKERGSRDG